MQKLQCTKLFQLPSLRRLAYQSPPPHASMLVCFLILCLLSPRLPGQAVPAIQQKPAAAQNPATELPQAVLTDLGTRKFGDDWNSFLGPTRDSKSGERGILTDWADGKLKVVWQLPLNESYGTCTISRGRAFQFDSEDGQAALLCLHSETGEELWKYTYPYEYRDDFGYNNGPRNSPIIDGNRVYILGVAGQLTCVDADSGKSIWTVDTAKQYKVVKNFFGVGSNPIIYGDLLIVMVGGSPKETRVDLAKGNGTGIVAFNKLTGREVYRLSDELASYASLQLTEHAGRPWCFAFARGGLLTFDPRNGKQDSYFPWRAKNPYSVNASVPVIIDHRVFISETYGPGSAMLDFTKPTPNVIWQDELKTRDKAMQTHWNTAVYHDGYLYGSSGRHKENAELRCIDARDGTVKWTQGGLTRSSLLYVDDHFVCLSEDGILRLIKASPEKLEVVTGIRLVADGRPMLREPAWAAPVLSHGLLYVRGDTRLVCLDLIPQPP